LLRKQQIILVDYFFAASDTAGDEIRICLASTLLSIQAMCLDRVKCGAWMQPCY